MKKSKAGRLLMTVGCLLLAEAVLLAGYNFVSEWKADRLADETTGELRKIIPERTSSGSEPLPEAEPSENSRPDTAAAVQTVTLKGESYIGILEVPAIGIELPVNSVWNSRLLRQSPCCYHGSAPSGDLIVAGHNYDRHFGKLKLLKSGDQVLFTDADGCVYRYAVTSTETVSGNDISGMEAGDWDLTLFTCTYSGFDRVAVRCKLAGP